MTIFDNADIVAARGISLAGVTKAAGGFHQPTASCCPTHQLHVLLFQKLTMEEKTYLIKEATDSVNDFHYKTHYAQVIQFLTATRLHHSDQSIAPLRHPLGAWGPATQCDGGIGVPRDSLMALYVSRYLCHHHIIAFLDEPLQRSNPSYDRDVGWD